MYYDNALLKSKNKIKTTWSIIKGETGYKIHNKEPQALKVNNIITREKRPLPTFLMNTFLHLHKQL
jgi:hypothetical protein